MIQYNQTINWVYYPWCRLLSNLIAMSNTTGKRITDEQMIKFANYARYNWISPRAWGNYIKWPTTTTKRWFDNMWDKFHIRKTNIWWLAFFKMLDIGLYCVVSITISNELNSDARDWKLDLLEYWKGKGHTICIWKIWDDYCLIDSSNRKPVIVPQENFKKSNLWRDKTALFFMKR